MNWRATLVLMAVAGLCAMLVLKFPALRATLLRNKATYLINQGKFLEAEERLKGILTANPEDTRTQSLLAESLMNRGQFALAEKSLGNLPSSGQSAFFKAACNYEQNHENIARSFFQEAADAKKEPLSDIQQNIVQLAINPECATLLRDDALEKSFSGDSFQQTIAYSLAGRALFDRWDYPESCVILESAFLRGDRNSRSYLRLCESLAMSRQFSKAEYYLDRIPDPNLYETMDAELSQLSNQFTTGALSLDDIVSRNSLKERLEEALAWTRVKNAMKNCPDQAPEALTFLNDFLAKYPARLQPSTLKGDLLESMGRDREAYLQYETVFHKQAGYALLLRMKALAGDVRALETMETDILHSPTVRAFVPSSDMASSSATTMKGFLAFFKSGGADLNFTLPCSGQYQICMVAKCDRAFGLGALVRVSIDGDEGTNLYIAGEEWDCYPLYVRLKQGTHKLAVEYLNNSERLLSTDEDRNFYLQSFIVSSCESREIERAGKP